MKTLIFGLMILAICGCRTSEFQYPTPNKQDLKGYTVGIEGFYKIVRVQAGGASSTGFSSNNTVTTINTTYWENQRDFTYAKAIAQALENQGANVRSRNPEIIISGPENMHLELINDDWTNGLINWATLFTYMPVDKHANMEVKIYSKNGNFLKKYNITQSYNNSLYSIIPIFPSMGFGLINANTRTILTDALTINFINQFTADLKSGEFKKIENNIKSDTEHFPEESWYDSEE